MSPDSRESPEQEHSIKARGNELFVARQQPVNQAPAQPFEEYLRKTPAQPLSTLTKALLSLVAIVVALMLVAALWKVTYRSRSRAESKRAAAKAAISLMSPPARRAGNERGPSSRAQTNWQRARIAVVSARGYFVDSRSHTRSGIL